jgi:hypothetical protein
MCNLLGVLSYLLSVAHHLQLLAALQPHAAVSYDLWIIMHCFSLYFQVSETVIVLLHLSSYP